jgi:hypothetical protein
VSSGPPTTSYAPAGGIAPGEVAVIGGGKGPAKITTGVRVIYADKRSWSDMTPEGHPRSVAGGRHRPRHANQAPVAGGPIHHPLDVGSYRRTALLRM